MKLILLACLLFAGNAFATLIPIDLGPPTYRVPKRTVIPFSPPVNAFEGQTISLDFVFAKGEFLRFIDKKNPASFGADVVLICQGTGLLVGPTGSGYAFDAQGNPLSNVNVPGIASVFTDHEEVVGLLLGGFNPNYNQDDVYGLHLNLLMPANSDFQIIGGIFSMWNSDYRHTLGRVAIGPHVPDTGSTAAILAFGLIALLFARKTAISDNNKQ